METYTKTFVTIISPFYIGVTPTKFDRSIGDKLVIDNKSYTCISSNHTRGECIEMANIVINFLNAARKSGNKTITLMDAYNQVKNQLN